MFNCVNLTTSTTQTEQNDMTAITKDQAATLNNNDQAFAWSVSNRDICNMQICLRAHGFKHGADHAEIAIWLAEQGKRSAYLAKPGQS